jgi:excisionase family DNA binding protein
VSDYMTVAELARDRRVGLSTAYRWVNEYGLPHYRGPSTRFRIDPDDFQEWFKQFRQVRNLRSQELPYKGSPTLMRG